MPRFDGTGPRGQGPRTGRGFGNCRSKNNTLSKEEQKKILLEEKEKIEQELANLENGK